MVGGGLVGLTTALVLRHHGVEVTLVEKRATTSPQPKARRFHVRSLEIFRGLGLAEVVREAARDLAEHDHMATGHTLAEARQLPLWQPSGSGDPVEISPELPCLVAQDVMEPVLRQAAEDAGARVRFQTELTSFAQDADGVSAELHDHRTGEDTALRAAFVVAADGARSPVRSALGIDRSGRGAIGDPSVNVYFHADLSDVVRGREFNLCKLEHPALPGALASVDGRYRWVFMTGGEVERDWPALLRTALGVPAPDLEVRSVLPWQAEMLVADRYSDGRVHLAGDAAHVMPPFAALGANTGIADAHNLGWKLAAVLSGAAAPALLDSYDAERRAAGWFTADQSSRRTWDATTAPDPTLADPFVLAAGAFQYPAGAFAGDLDDVEPVTEFAPAGRIATRIPHRWLDTDLSTLDIAGPGWALAVADDPQRWAADGIPAHRLDADFLAPGEGLLIRPDDVIAWRGTDPTTPATVREKLLAG
ncbi:2-polyprenyl-6-methoxyphenol hydroxylase [Saccharopolyspora kobensis]|uniref:2-polyprenyl-6-methoxyphenol hydroxylase n=1 Tax=Saccharopolyspora kobensis TaxID=146035 RepID=A0A1H6DND6_9PSEU|nr:2-polyprenyl-6-methoxyphenol hydroxylase [Saccharopolyspora kobensis]SFF01572.1 2-polyprenyl-6-methoxyphenol hydroxylase [Saccharopolyspora kobensis]